MKYTIVALFGAVLACGSSGNGQIKVTMTDAPVSDANVKEVLITYDELRIHDEASDASVDGGTDDGSDGKGWIVLCSETRTVDLLTIQNGNFTPVCTQALADGGSDVLPITVPAGNISQLRLHVTSAKLTFKDGSPDATLVVPSGTTSGLKINVGKDVPAGGTLDLKVDFDAGASLSKQGNGTWKFAPVLKVMN